MEIRQATYTEIAVTYKKRQETTLYEKLETIDNMLEKVAVEAMRQDRKKENLTFNNIYEIINNTKDYNKIFAQIEETGKYCKDLPNFRKIPVFELGRELILSYDGHPIMKEVIKDGKTIEGITRELANDCGGIRSWIPWPADKEHNERAEYLGDIISETEVLMHRPFNAYGRESNFFMNSIYASGIMAMSLAIVGITYNPNKTMMMIKEMAIPIGITVGATITALTRNDDKKVIENAIKMDRKLAEYDIISK